MKKIIFICLLIVMCIPTIGLTDHKETNSYSFEPEITLFESVETIKNYIKEKDLKFEGMYPYSITLRYIEGYPKKGRCWQWHYAWKKPKMGGEISLFHYMDGTIIELNHGP